MLELFTVPTLTATSVLVVSLLIWWFIIEQVFQPKKVTPRDKNSSAVNRQQQLPAETSSHTRTNSADNNPATKHAAPTVSEESSRANRNALKPVSGTTHGETVSEGGNRRQTAKNFTGTRPDKRIKSKSSNNSKATERLKAPQKTDGTTKTTVTNAGESSQSPKTRPKPRLKMRLGRRSGETQPDTDKQFSRQKQPGTRSVLSADTHTTENPKGNTAKPDITHTASKDLPPETKTSSTPEPSTTSSTQRATKQSTASAYMTGSKTSAHTATKKQDTHKPLRPTRSTKGTPDTQVGLNKAPVSITHKRSPSTQKSVSSNQLVNSSQHMSGLTTTTGLSSKQSTRPTLPIQSSVKPTAARQSSPVTTSESSVKQTTEKNSSPALETAATQNPDTSGSTKMSPGSTQPQTGSANKKTNAPTAQTTRLQTWQSTLKHTKPATHKVASDEANDTKINASAAGSTTTASEKKSATKLSEADKSQTAATASDEKSSNSPPTSSLSVTSQRHKQTDTRQQQQLEPATKPPVHTRANPQLAAPTVGQAKSTIAETDSPANSTHHRPTKTTDTKNKPETAKYQTAAKAQSPSVRSEASLQIPHPATSAKATTHTSELSNSASETDKASGTEISVLNKTNPKNTKLQNAVQTRPQSESNLSNLSASNVSQLITNKQSNNSNDRGKGKANCADNSVKSAIEMAMERQSDDPEETDETPEHQNISRSNTELHTKLVASERKIASLQSTINHMQHESSSATTSTVKDTVKKSANRPTLLSKVRVLHPSDV